MISWMQRGAFMKASTMVAGLLFLCFAFFSGTAYAIHKGAGALVCGGCHTMHNSQGGSPLGGNAGGSLILLRGAVSTRAEIHKFCLQCHGGNGAQASTLQPPQNVMAPKVWSSATWTSDDPFNLIGSGGNFSPELDTNWDVATTNMLGKGHSLGATNIVPPGGEGDPSIATFSCTNCHDPHGTSSPADANINLYRNLRVNATGAGVNSGVKFVNDPTRPYREHHSYVGGVNGTYFGGGETDNASNTIWPVYRGVLTGVPAADSANSNSYGTGQDNGDPAKVTMSKWCSQCHDNWHEANAPANYVGFPDAGQGPDWRRHPVNGMMARKATQGCAANCHTSLNDRSTYSLALIQDGKGIPVTASSYYAGNDVYYLPYEAPCVGAIGCMDLAPNTSGDNHKVFCLSCHFAHGGPYNDNLRWDYTSVVGTGSQTGNGVPVTKGCQLCHNR